MMGNRVLNTINVLVGFSKYFLIFLAGSTSLIASTHHAGATLGQFNVNDQGAANYSIPIEVPPGINGMQPKLSLNYNSQSGNGLLGMGWSLGGLSAINRCPQDLAQDGKIHGVNFSNTDRLCLNGQRLVPVTWDNTDAGYWAATEFRTVRVSFSKITLMGTVGSGTEYFVVKTKSGQTMEYGNSPDSFINANNVATGLERKEAYIWSVNKISDTFGNKVEFSYIEDSVNGFYHINRIDYGYVGATPSLSVRFSTQARGDNKAGYIAGSKASTQKRFSNIKTFTNDSEIKNYKINYEYGVSTNRTRLNSLEECDITSFCKEATTLSWKNGDGTFDFQQTLPGASIATNSYIDTNHKNILLGDWNGDGLTDMLHLHPSEPTQYSWVAISQGDGTFDFQQTLPGASIATNSYIDTNHKNILLGDWNGDGLTDMLHLHPSEPSQYSWVAISQGDGTFDFQQTLPGASIATNSYIDTNHKNILLGDWNGDGLTDMLHLHPSEPSQYSWVAISQGDGTFDFQQTLPGASIATNSYIDTNHKNILLGDWNGDGLTDMLHLHPSEPSQYSWVAISQGDGTFDFQQTLPGASIATNSYIDINHKNILLGDWNGDGLTDMLHLHPSEPTQYSWVAISQGDGTFDFQQTLPGASIATNSYIDINHKNILLGDWNGDGLTDMLHLHPSEPTQYSWVAISQGDGTFDFQQTLPGASIATNSYIDTNHKNILLGDWNGDGLTDMLHLHPSEPTQYSWVAMAKGAAPDLLTTIANGFGEQTSINYNTLTDNTIYTKYTTAIYPIRNIQSTMYVVSSSSKSDGIGGMYTHTYKYEGAKVHQKGRGFLGFAKRSITDTQTGIVKEINYRQDLPFIGSVESTSTKLANGSPLNNTSNIWVDLLNGDPNLAVSATNRFNVQLQQSDEISNELDGSLVSNITKKQTFYLDGNVDQVIVDTNDGYIKTNKNTYYPRNDTTWISGLIETSAVTIKTPTDLVGITRNSRFEYDPVNGALLKEIIEPNDLDLELIKTNTYNAYGNKDSITVSGANILPRTTIHTYDYSGLFNLSNPHYRIVSVNPLLHSETKIIDARWGQVSSLTGPNNLTTSWSFDTLGRKVREDRADGNWTTIDYTICEIGCAYGSPLQITSTKSGSTPVTIYYDMLGREVMKELVGFDGGTVYRKSMYDNFGRVSDVSLPYFAADAVNWHRYEYDLLGRNIREDFPDSSFTTIARVGLTTIYTNDKGQVTKKTKNSQGKLVESIDAALNKNTYEYDALGYLIKVTDAAGNSTSMNYNKRGHKISMDDPDMGHWEYGYNVLGKLVWQKDAKGQEASIVYDLLSRMVKRTEIEGVSEWFYDTAVNGKGKLEKVTGVNGFSQTIQYDQYGRANDTKTVISGLSLNMNTVYDTYGRIVSTTYPEGLNASRLTVINIYNTYGYLSEIRNAANTTAYWQASTVDASGRIQDHTLGNGLTSSKFFNQLTGRIEGIKTGAGLSGVEVQNLAYSFDTLGNLVSRDDGNKNLTETFTYDELNRLESATIAGQASQAFTYDSIGNIKSKTGVGSYFYGELGAGPHAVTTAGTTTYAYDANGNQINGDGRTLTYTSFNKPKTIAKGSSSSTFYYGPNQSRIKQELVNNGLTTVTNYLGKVYEVVTKPDGVTEYKYYINTAGASVIVTERSNSLHDTRYIFKDHLGSSDVITDETGKVVEGLSFDAFGARREALNWATATTPIISLTTRGYTGHEMHDDFGLVNMNARMYDAKLGRFLQPDTYVQFPQSTQGFNRYTYVNNNPLSYTDPTGHFVDKLFKDISKVISHIAKNISEVIIHAGNSVNSAINGINNGIKNYFLDNEWARQLAGLYASVNPWFAAAYAAYITEISGGSAEDIAKSFAYGYISTKIYDQINDIKVVGFESGFTKVVTKGMAGGLFNMVQGGSFKDGFNKAVAVQLVTMIYTESLKGAKSCRGGCDNAQPTVGSETSQVDNKVGDGFTIRYSTSNNFGFSNCTNNPFCEGQWASSFFNLLPFMHGTSNLHDVWNPTGSSWTDNGFYFWGTMPISAAVVYYSVWNGQPPPINRDHF